MPSEFNQSESLSTRPTTTYYYMSHPHVSLFLYTFMPGVAALK